MKKYTIYNPFLLFLLTKIQAAETASPAHVIQVLNTPTKTHFADTLFFGNNILSIGYNDEKTEAKIYLFDLIKNNYSVLYTKDMVDPYEHYFIGMNNEHNKAIISLHSQALLLEFNKEQEIIAMTPANKATFCDNNTIIWIKIQRAAPLCEKYDIETKSNTLFTILQNAIESPQLRNGRDVDYGGISKTPTNDEYLISLLENIAVFNANQKVNEDNPKVIPLIATIINGDKKYTDYHPGPWDIQQSKNGYATFTDLTFYNAWSLDLRTQKLYHLTKETDISYPVDSKMLHPFLPIIATLRKDAGEIIYWKADTGKLVLIENLPDKSEQEPNGCLTHFMSFSQDGKMIVVAICGKIVIASVPQKILNIKQ